MITCRTDTIFKISDSELGDEYQSDYINQPDYTRTILEHQRETKYYQLNSLIKKNYDIETESMKSIAGTFFADPNFLIFSHVIFIAISVSMPKPVDLSCILSR